MFRCADWSYSVPPPCEAGSSPTIGRRWAAAGFHYLLSLLVGKCCSERPGAVKGAPIGAAQRTLDGEDRSERMAEEGKQVV